MSTILCLGFMIVAADTCVRLGYTELSGPVIAVVMFAAIALEQRYAESKRR